MLKIKRLDKIKAYINEHGSASLDELVKEFGVSKNTIRRDVQTLIEGGAFKKVYGGVEVNKPNTTVPFDDRKVHNIESKQKIGKAAAEFVENGDIIFIDSGTTTVEMVDYIKDKELTIITNNIAFIFRAFPYNNLSIFSTGGMMERRTNSFTSADNDEIITTYNIKKAFLATTGLTIKNGVTNSLPLESSLKKSVVERSTETFLLADYSKFGKSSLTTYSELNEIDFLVTDNMPEAFYTYTQENGINVVYPEN
ncbi:DeoR/GlpR family DNA-binding transcription regulator [Lentibacillus salinarum]|uniref:DeoR/GlpR family DNA-binding transcription regulator n=1 Tax=Lentibacillus salinarum TaxID=446820 RepID=A0ABW3ZW25_9BACI